MLSYCLKCRKKSKWNELLDKEASRLLSNLETGAPLNKILPLGNIFFNILFIYGLYCLYFYIVYIVYIIFIVYILFIYFRYFVYKWIK